MAVWGGGSRGGDRYGGTRQAPRRGQDVESPLTITLEEAYHGGTRSLQLAVPSGRYDLSRGGDDTTVRRVEVKIPAGISDGQKIRLAGQGGDGQGGAGDLFLIVQIAPHAQFERTRDDLTVDVPLPYYQAALGGKVSVPTIKGSRLSMTVPPGTQSGQRFKLGGQGMPRRKEGGWGDLYARAKITVPRTPDERERDLLKQIADLHAPAAADTKE